MISQPTWGAVGVLLGPRRAQDLSERPSRTDFKRFCDPSWGIWGANLEDFGWKEQIPFDRIIITAATPYISEDIASQINEGGIIVSPINKNNKQIIIKYTKIDNVLKSEIFDNVLFVPNLPGIE